MSDDFQDIFDDVDKIYQRFAKRMFKEMEDIEEAIKSGKIAGEWDIKPIEEPGVKGYIAKGRFELGDKPTQPKTLTLPKDIPQEMREPLTDIFEDEENINLYIELPGVEKKDVKFNVSDGKAEIKAKNFHKNIELPAIDVEAAKTRANYKNGVLEVTIPKKKKTPAKQTGTPITIE